MWSSLIAEHLLDRLVVEGNASFTLFFLLALMQQKQAELLTLDQPEAVKDTLLILPWGLVESDLHAVFQSASTFRETTPVSILYGLYGIESQCSPGLLPVAVQGTMDVWKARMHAFYR